jgi:hypothetical protein
MSRIVLSIMMVMVLAGGVFANIPDPTLSNAPPVLLVPNNPNTLGPPFGPNVLGYTVNVQGNLGPVNNALVEVAFSQAAWVRIAKCNGTDTRPAFCDVTPPADYICTATTNASGNATFRISGGGCILATAVNPYTVEIRANGIVLANDIKIFSPDAVNGAGQTTASSGVSNCDATATAVGLSDAVFHTGDFAGITFNECSDFDNSHSANLADAVIGTQYIVNGNSCTCTP